MNQGNWGQAFSKYNERWPPKSVEMDLGKLRRSHASNNVSWPTKSVDMDDGSRGIGGKAFENTTKTIGNDPRTLGPSHFKNHE